MEKSTYYHYKKTRPLQGAKSALIKADETEAEWINRLIEHGLTIDQVEAIREIDSLEAFVAYCIAEGFEEAGIAGNRLETFKI